MTRPSGRPSLPGPIRAWLAAHPTVAPSDLALACGCSLARLLQLDLPARRRGSAGARAIFLLIESYGVQGPEIMWQMIFARALVESSCTQSGHGA